MNVFIFGPQRSGSTLLFNLISKHNSVLSTPNDLNILGFFNKKQNKSIIKNLKTYWGIEEIPEYDNKSDFLLKILKLYFNKNLDNKFKEIILHKVPKGEFSYSTYRKVLPESKYIFLLRNPISIMASRKYWGNSNPNFSIWNDILPQTANFDNLHTSFKYMQRHLDDIFRSFVMADLKIDNKSTLKVLSYEDLIDNAGIVLTNICELLELSTDYVNSAVSSIEDPYTSYSSLSDRIGIYTDSLGMWANKLTAMEQSLILNELKKFYYDHGFKSEIIKTYIKEYINNIEEVMKSLM